MLHVFVLVCFSKVESLYRLMDSLSESKFKCQIPGSPFG